MTICIRCLCGLVLWRASVEKAGGLSNVVIPGGCLDRTIVKYVGVGRLSNLRVTRVVYELHKSILIWLIVGNVVT